MKKIISIALALVMMMAFCAPAFATQDVSAPGDTPVDVLTTYDASTDSTYTVTIPASISVEWGNTNTVDASYSVTSQLLVGASIKVNVAYDADADDTNNGVMTATGTTQKLYYALEGEGEATFSEVNTDAKASTVGGTDAKISIADFSGAPVAEYKGTVTYTVTYVVP